jgi:pullulanase
MLGLVISLLLPAWGESAFPLAIHGARARFENSENITYFPSSWLDLRNLRVEVLDLDSGKRLSVSVERQDGGSWILKPVGNWPSLENWIQQSAMLTISDLSGNELDRTYFQTGNLLDSLFHYDGCLGVCWERAGKPVLKVWAPTARSVSVVMEGQVHPMRRGKSGVWEKAGDSSWKNKSYLYEVEVFTPATGRLERQQVTDPYSLALTENSKASFVLDPKDPAWMPAGWEGHSRPALEARTDAVLYELHVREFSRFDETVPADLRGTFRGFTVEGSQGDRHLRELAEAGITHIHLLPVSDFATVEENSRFRRDPSVPGNLPPDSPIPQQELQKTRALDSFNWGYDPFHYFAPDGSYSVEPDSPLRVKEFRELVLSLHKRGLRVVNDMVFNHTYSSGIAPDSVLDKIVPGYYYRLTADGSVQNSSCCSDTASERWMMEKLMRDSLNSWRENFGVDGFRFDLMNLHSVGVMTRIRDYLRKKDPSILLYGEAWPFGSLLDRSPQDAYVQTKAYGNGIGVFNDRLRDAVRGGTTDSKEKSDQGYVTGLFYDFNHEPANRDTPLDLGAQRERLLHYGDVVRVGMAGNLREFTFRDHRGNALTGGKLFFRGAPTGFSANPEETINYVAAHDGYSLFDALQAKLPFHTAWRNPATATIQERLERQILAAGIVALSQGVPFFDSGIETLRSKSGDQNSYDSGDWFNRLDWSYESNGWGLGLPPAHSNPNDWAFWRPRLADEALRVKSDDIRAMKEAFLALLRVRKSSPLFRLKSAAEIQARVHFLESDLGPMQPPGLIVMEISDSGQDLDPKWRRMIVALNVTNDSMAFSHESLRGRALENLFGTAVARPSMEAQLLLPARSISVWGERQ